MAAERTTFNVSARDVFGSRATRRLRREGFVPGVVYGQGGEARPFQVNGHDLQLFLNEGHTLLDLKIDGGDAVPVVIKEEQRHPLRGEIVHLDCLEVRLDQAIQSEVPIELEGADQAPGVREEGGILEHVTREVTVEALPTDIPEQILVDVSEMVIGDTMTLESVTAPSGTTFIVDEPAEFTIATLSPPRVEEEPEPDLEEEAELVGEDGEPVEGDGDAEGGDDDGDSGDGDGGGDEGGDGE